MRAPSIRPGDLALGLISLAFLAFLSALLFAGDREEAAREWAANRRLVSEFGLSDLCLVTEARYTRHLSQTDLHAPFQDHPMALEHFPSGALFSPPPYLTRHAPLDS